VKIWENGKILIECLYFDDLIFTGNSSVMFAKLKKCMMNEFKMFDFGKMHYFIVLEVVQSNAGIFVSQKKYVREISNKFKMQNCYSTNIQLSLA